MVKQNWEEQNSHFCILRKHKNHKYCDILFCTLTAARLQAKAMEIEESSKLEVLDKVSRLY